MRPNILLVVLDTARRDVIEPYGQGMSHTPAIAELARQGQAAQHAYATASWTLPSHASMFTGLLPRELGLAQPPDGTPEGARSVLTQIPEQMVSSVLSGAGYKTLGWSTNLWASHHAGFDIGFDRFNYVHSGRVDRVNDLVGGGPRAKFAWAREGFRAQSDDGAAKTGEELRESIAAWSGQPTFWFVNLSECHSPYLPPRPWNDLGGLERVRGALDCQRHLSFLSICLYAAGRHRIEPEAMDRLRHLHARAASYMDDWISSILDSLEARGILSETLVIVTSDHGENFGEAGLIAHGFALNETLIHVPLVMAGPGAPKEDGARSLAELPDVLVKAAGIEEHPYRARTNSDGVAIAHHDPMGTVENPRVRSFVQEWSLDKESLDRITAQYTVATDGRLKLVLRGDEELLYDLGADPEESRPLDGSARVDSVARLRAALEAAERSENEAPVTSEQPVQTGGASPQELAELEQQMKLLGYM